MKSINSVSMAKIRTPDKSNVLDPLCFWSIQPIRITSLEKNIWSELEVNIALSLDRLRCIHLLDPVMIFLHRLITSMVKTMQYNIFQQIVENDFCLNVDANRNVFDELFENELTEHGDRNIAKFCQQEGVDVTLYFPEQHEAILTIHYPLSCNSAAILDMKLSEAIGFTLIKDVVDADIDANISVAKLVKVSTGIPVIPSLPNASVLMSQQAELDNMQSIFSQLGYGIICFSSTGVILAISPAILAYLRMEQTQSSVKILGDIIPSHFYNDVIWGLALETPEGIFENYRIRIKLPNTRNLSILFNISGYRDHDTTIHSLWQIVSLEGKETSLLTEGSMLNEARIHNITRNYVPQLVEQKAREVVRLGGRELTNEECLIAVLFCDIVGFTSYVENNENEESVIHTLNSILGRISKTVKRHNGLIDKFMGDCVMVLFRNPLNAVTAALEMQKHSIDINNLRLHAGKQMLLLRVGIHWGKVVIGNVGISGRLDWTTIGDVVNTASSLEKNCQPGAVLISQAMFEAIDQEKQADVRYGEVFTLKLKGKCKELAVRYAYSPQEGLETKKTGWQEFLS